MDASTFNVSPIRCQSCAKAIEHSLIDLPGVRSVEVSVVLQTVIVTHQTKSISHSDIRCVLIGIGFTVEFTNAIALPDDTQKLLMDTEILDNDASTINSEYVQNETPVAVNARQDSLSLDVEIKKRSITSFQKIHEPQILDTIKNFSGVLNVTQVGGSEGANVRTYQVTYSLSETIHYELQKKISRVFENHPIAKLHPPVVSCLGSTDTSFGYLRTCCIIAFTLTLCLVIELVRTATLVDSLRPWGGSFAGSHFLSDILHTWMKPVLFWFSAVHVSSLVGISLIFLEITLLTVVILHFGTNLRRRAIADIRRGRLTIDVFVFLNCMLCFAFGLFDSHMKLSRSITAAVDESTKTGDLFSAIPKGHQLPQALLITFNKYVSLPKHLQVSVNSSGLLSTFLLNSALLVLTNAMGMLLVHAAKSRIVRMLMNLNSSRCKTDVCFPATTGQPEPMIHRIQPNNPNFKLQYQQFLSSITRVTACCGSQHSDIIEDLMNQDVHDIWLHIEQFDAYTLKRGDIIRLKDGEECPADVLVLRCEPESFSDQSVMTGEELSLPIQVGDRISEGCHIVSRAPMICIVEFTGERTELGRMRAEIVNTASYIEESSLCPFAEKCMEYLALFFLGLSLSTCMLWTAIIYKHPSIIPRISDAQWINGLYFVQSFGFSVLAMACPCALNLAAPMSVMIGMTKALKSGILIKKPNKITATSNIGHIVFDKTGVIENKCVVTSHKVNNTRKLMKYGLATQTAEQRLFMIVNAIEARDVHPIGVALYNYTKSQDVLPVLTHSKTTYPCGGISAMIYDKHRELATLYLGNYKLYAGITKGMVGETNLAPATSDRSLFLFYASGDILATFTYTLYMSPSDIHIMRALNRKYALHLLSGDTEKNCDHISQELPNMSINGSRTPAGKRDYILDLNELNEGSTIMIGDGNNDSLSLINSSIAIAVTTKSSAANYASDIVIVGSPVEALNKFLIISRHTQLAIKLSIIWAFIFNSLMIPLAAGVYYPHMTITPIMSSLVMSLNTAIVLLISFLVHTIGDSVRQFESTRLYRAILYMGAKLTNFHKSKDHDRLSYRVVESALAEV